MSFKSLKTYLPNLRLLSVPAACLAILAVQPATVHGNTMAPAEVSEGTEAIDLSNPALMTTFEGILMSTGMESIGIIQLRVSRGGRTSARITSAGARGSGRATIDDAGVGTGSVRIGRSTMPLTFQVNDGATAGTFVLDGEIADGAGATAYTFAANPPAYDRRATPVEAGDYSMALLGATMSDGDVPLGDGAGDTRVGRGGRVTSRGYNADGSRFSSRGTILEGGTTIFYSRLGRDGMAIGELTFQNIAGMSDFDGDVFYTRSYTGRGAYPGAYSYTANAVGNLWSQGMDVRTAMGLGTDNNNAVLRLTGGPLGGLDIIATVDWRGRISIPRTQTVRLNGRVNTRSGIANGNVQVYDPPSGYTVQTRAKFFAGVLPKMGTTNGSYVAQNGAGLLEIVDNTAGTLPPITNVIPRVRGIGEFGGGYPVQITASEPWSVEIPEEDQSWISVTPESGVVDPETGSADGTVIVTVAKAISPQDRQSFMTIAGQNHVVVQRGSSSNINIVTINPEVKTVGILGGNYFVSITATSPNSIPATGFFSPVDWVAVVPFNDPVTGILLGANITVAEPTGGITVGDPSAILRSAEVLVGGVRHTVNQVFAIVPEIPGEPVAAAAP